MMKIKVLWVCFQSFRLGTTQLPQQAQTITNLKKYTPSDLQNTSAFLQLLLVTKAVKLISEWYLIRRGALRVLEGTDFSFESFRSFWLGFKFRNVKSKSLGEASFLHFILNILDGLQIGINPQKKMVFSHMSSYIKSE